MRLGGIEILSLTLLAGAAYLRPLGGVPGMVTMEQAAPVRTVASVNLDRYLGEWYETARFPNRFQRTASVAAVTPFHHLKQARVAAPTVVETTLVLTGRRRQPASGEIEALLEELGIAVVPFGEAEWPHAVAAFNKCGRGRHPAGLNFGDCLAYAAAAAAGDSLLYVGDDFARTDIPAARRIRP